MHTKLEDQEHLAATKLSQLRRLEIEKSELEREIRFRDVSGASDTMEEFLRQRAEASHQAHEIKLKGVRRASKRGIHKRAVRDELAWWWLLAAFIAWAPA